MLSWRSIAMWGHERPLALKVADRLGRSRGGLRLFDRLDLPAAAELKPDLSDWENQELAAAWVGHATVLLRLGGMTVLTDPVFGSRVGIGLGLVTGGPTRLTAPALRMDELPKIDLILISHAHFDHLDRPSLDKLPKRTPVVTAAETSDLISDLGFGNVTELRWGERAQVGSVGVTACEVKHWGARTFHDGHRGFNGYLLESGRRRILYGGDTAYHENFKSLPGVDLAVMGIGAYDPWIASHANPEQALAMADQVRADFVMPMHHSTFRLSREPLGEPIERIVTAAGRNEGRIVAREIGASWSLRAA
jgi:L-ascorbate metabolism protein UlaG (beta-lactamase superfamily)